jgi:MFS family permease
MADLETPPHPHQSTEKEEIEVLIDNKTPKVLEEEGTPMTSKTNKNSTNITDSTAVYDWLKTKYEHVHLPRSYRLVTEKSVLDNSIQSVRFSCMCAAINTKMLNPNYPIMVTQDAHPDSFPDTEPFDFNSATYFLPMCSLLGVAIASIFLGQVSDRVGRKKVLIVLSWVSAVGSIVKFFTRETFWGFCITQIVFGFFLGNLPVAMAYVGDVYTSQKKKQQELGVLVSCFVVGNSGGGIIAILMYGSGLFSPLWVGAGLMVMAGIGSSWYMVEAGDLERMMAMDDDDDDDDDDETRSMLLKGEGGGGNITKGKGNDEEEIVRPEVIDNKAVANIILGALFDNFGSTGLFPLCLSPLAINQYLLDFVSADPPEDPIMSFVGYQWLSVMVAGMVVPSTLMTPAAFRRFGVAGTCVMGNVMTAFVTLALLLIGNGVRNDCRV